MKPKELFAQVKLSTKLLQGIILALSLAIFAPHLACASGDSMKSPWAEEKQPGRFVYPQGPNPSLPASFLTKAIDIFQNFISPVDGPRSKHYPTSSAYSRQAIAKHGALLGFLLTADRLIREFYPSKSSPVVFRAGLPRFYDPLEANDFWFPR